MGYRTLETNPRRSKTCSVKLRLTYAQADLIDSYILLSVLLFLAEIGSYENLGYHHHCMSTQTSESCIGMFWPSIPCQHG